MKIADTQRHTAVGSDREVGPFGPDFVSVLAIIFTIVIDYIS